MPAIPLQAGPSLEKRALGAARLEGARRRKALIKRRVSAFAALVMIVIWAVVLAETWQPGPFNSDPAAGQSPALQSPVPSETSSPSAQVTPSPAPVVSSQS